MSTPAYYIPTSDAALAECRRLKLSEILDRTEALEKTMRKAYHDSDEYKQAAVMLKAAQIVMLCGEYQKVQA